MTVSFVYSLVFGGTGTAEGRSPFLETSINWGASCRSPSFALSGSGPIDFSLWIA